MAQNVRPQHPLRITLCEFYCTHFSHVINKYLSETVNMLSHIFSETENIKYYYNDYRWKWLVKSKRDDVYWEDSSVRDNNYRVLTSSIHGKDVCYNYDKTKLIHVKYWKNCQPVHRHKYYRLNGTSADTRVILNYKKCIGKIYRGTTLIKQGKIDGGAFCCEVFPSFSYISDMIQ